MNQDYYKEEMMLKEAITQQKTDAEIGMPDVEEELRRVKHMAKKDKPMFVGWRRIAAICTLVLSVSGLSWAIAYYQQYQTEKAQTELQQTAEETTEDTNKETVTEEQELTPSAELTLSYDKASLQQIIVDLTAFYQLEEPVFKDKENAASFMMHITLNREATIQESIELLNHFGSVNIELTDNRLVVK